MTGLAEHETGRGGTHEPDEPRKVEPHKSKHPRQGGAADPAGKFALQGFGNQSRRESQSHPTEGGADGDERLEDRVSARQYGPRVGGFHGFNPRELLRPR